MQKGQRDPPIESRGLEWTVLLSKCLLREDSSTAGPAPSPRPSQGFMAKGLYEFAQSLLSLSSDFRVSARLFPVLLPSVRVFSGCSLQNLDPGFPEADSEPLDFIKISNLRVYGSRVCSRWVPPERGPHGKGTHTKESLGNSYPYRLFSCSSRTLHMPVAGGV